jgi:hypothetical protein
MPPLSLLSLLSLSSSLFANHSIKVQQIKPNNPSDKRRAQPRRKKDFDAM